MDIYYIKERLLCSEKEKMECMPLVKHMIQIYKVASKNGLLDYLEEIQMSEYYDKMPLFKVVVPLFDTGSDWSVVRTVLENYIVLSDVKGKELLEALIVLEGFCGVVEGKSRGTLLECICSYFGLEFREQFYKFMKPSFLNDNSF